MTIRRAVIPVHRYASSTLHLFYLVLYRLYSPWFVWVTNHGLASSS